MDDFSHNQLAVKRFKPPPSLEVDEVPENSGPPRMASSPVRLKQSSWRDLWEDSRRTFELC
jgi:hypothetical protein